MGRGLWSLEHIFRKDESLSSQDCDPGQKKVRSLGAGPVRKMAVMGL